MIAQRLAGRNLRIAPAGADENRGVGGIFWHEHAQRILGRNGVGDDGKFAAEIIRVNLRGEKHFL